jgi:hypothetical protein
MNEPDTNDGHDIKTDLNVRISSYIDERLRRFLTSEVRKNE